MGLVARKAKVLDVVGDDAHVVLERAVGVGGRLHEDEFGVDEEDDGRVGDVLGGVAVDCVSPLLD